MKKSFSIFSIFLMITSLASCSNDSGISFEKSMYEIHSGDKVAIEQDYKEVTYSFVDYNASGVSLDSKTGVITFTSEVPNYTQILYKAEYKEFTCSAVVTLLQHVDTPNIDFTSPIDYVSDGDYILTYIDNPNLAITYKLKQSVSGISIDSSTGKVSFTNACYDGQSFTVVISSEGVNKEKTFIVAKNALAKVMDKNQVIEDNGSPAKYYIDFKEVDPSFDKKILGLLKGHTFIESKYYSFNESDYSLVIDSSIGELLIPGENSIAVITPRNIVNLNIIKVTKLIRTPEDLQSINDTQESLQGYYILANDIDLTEYLSKDGKGYNEGKGWQPIGTYNDVTDGTALYYAFSGTFDGNGYVIRGFKYNRSDISGYNCGLFGYVTNLAVIKNVGIQGTGVSLGRSYIGGFVGVNAGTITNCWANVNVTNYSDGDVFKFCGGFVGRNMGYIENCYSLGSVNGDYSFGAFAGSNEADIINCYACKEACDVFCGDRDMPEEYLFATYSQMKMFDYSSIFSSTYWDFKIGSYPTLKTYLHSYYVDYIDFEIVNSNPTKGDNIELDVSIYPKELEKDYINDVVVSCNDPSIEIIGLTLLTSVNSLDTIQITVTLDVGDKTLTVSKDTHLYDQPTDIVFIDDLPAYIEPGKRYRLNAVVEPESAYQEIHWSIIGIVVGVTLEDNILTVTDMLNKYKKSSFTVSASAGNIIKSKELFINLPKFLSKGYSFYEEETDDLVIKMPSSVDLDDVKVYRYNKLTEFDVSGQTITISRDILKEIPDVSVCFNIRLKDLSYYQVYATYYTHKRINIESIQEQYIELSSKEDLYKYFNFKTYDESKYENYSKTFVLTADINLGGDKIYGIGVSDDEELYDYSFTGKIYGFGHKISSASITDNEKYFNLPEDKKDYKYRSSRYVVGFFGKFNGEVYDLVLEHIDVDANSYCGIFAGTIGADAYIENLSMVGCTLNNINDTDYSDPSQGIKSGYLASTNGGIYYGVTCNGATFNLVGE